VLFGNFYIAMIRVGEMTGPLTEVFLRLNEHMEFERDVRERIKQAMRYPSFVMIAMAAAIVILNIFVIPVFAKVFAGFNSRTAADYPRFARLLELDDQLVAHAAGCCGRGGGGHTRLPAHARRPLPLGCPQAQASYCGRHHSQGDLGPFCPELCLVQPERCAAGAGR